MDDAVHDRKSKGGGIAKVPGRSAVISFQTENPNRDAVDVGSALQDHHEIFPLQVPGIIILFLAVAIALCTEPVAVLFSTEMFNHAYRARRT